MLCGNISEGISERERALALQESLPESFRLHGSGAPRSLRWTTGEFTDSLLYDRDTRLSEKLISLFSGCRSAVLELKTKTASVGHLLDLRHSGRTVISFSVNSADVSEKYESGAGKLSDRVKAAGLASRRGWKVGFHFDPLIDYPGWCLTARPRRERRRPLCRGGTEKERQRSPSLWRGPRNCPLSWTLT